MKIKWERLIRLDRVRFLFAGSLLSIASIAFFYIRFSQPKPQSIQDLKIITGKLKSINFVDMPRGRYDYQFALDGYSNSFKIKADFLKYFDVKAFQQLETGRMITVGISKEDKTKLTTTKNSLLVYLIEENTRFFLDHRDTIAFQNSKRDYYYAVGLFCIGLILIYVGYNLQPKNTNA